MATGDTTAIDHDASLAALDEAIPDVYGYLLHRCRDRGTAEDLTSETFLAAVAALRRDPAAPVSVAWLIGIARHKLADHWREAARIERGAAKLAADANEVTEPAPFEPGRATAVLAMLNPAQRAALTLRYVDGLPVPEVARLGGRSVHATETLLMRAKAAFRRRYDAGGPGHD